MRQALALAALYGGGIFAYLWLGFPGSAGYALGIGGCLVMLGLASGYWIGADAQADILVTELMTWLRKKRSIDRDSAT